MVFFVVGLERKRVASTKASPGEQRPKPDSRFGSAEMPTSAIRFT